MVAKKKKSAPRPELRQDDAGRWLCNVTAGCSAVATMQASPEVLPPCSGCDDAGSEMKANLEQRHGELASIDSREGAIKAAAKSRRDTDQVDEAMELLDQVELRAIAERRKVLGQDIEGLTAAHARVVADHTHPLFACDKHASRLPT